MHHAFRAFCSCDVGEYQISRYVVTTKYQSDTCCRTGKQKEFRGLKTKTFSNQKFKLYAYTIASNRLYEKVSHSMVSLYVFISDSLAVCYTLAFGHDLLLDVSLTLRTRALQRFATFI